MNPAEAREFAARLRTDLPTIDLHGLYPSAAEERLERALYDAYQASHDGLRVIYGVGTGALRTHCLTYLKKHPLVETIAADDGMCTILFYR